MRTHVTLFVWVLGVTSLIAIVVGIATLVSAYTYTYGHVDRATAVMSESLEEMEQVVGVLNAHKSKLRQFEEVPTRIEATMRDLPELTRASSEALDATTETVDKTAAVVEAMQRRGDFMLAGSPLKEHGNALRRNSERLRALHSKMTGAQAALEQTVAESAGALQAVRSIGKRLRKPAPSLDELEGRLGDVRAMSDSGMMAAGAAGAQALVGGLYFLIGLLLGGLASLGTQLEQRQLRSRK